jgi:hypothetical protein
MMEGVNLTMIYYKNICKCHNVPPVQQSYDNKKCKKKPQKIKIKSSSKKREPYIF